METEHNVRALRKAQTVLALKAAREYRTISTSGILVLAELIPCDLLAKDRRRLYRDPALTQVDARLETIAAW